jgi:hypothetical protein
MKQRITKVIFFKKLEVVNFEEQAIHNNQKIKDMTLPIKMKFMMTIWDK